MKNFIVTAMTFVICILAGVSNATAQNPVTVNGTDQIKEYNRQKMPSIGFSLYGNQYGFPVENALEGLPEVVPCNFIDGRRNIVCDWNLAVRESTITVNCRAGICRQDGEVYGFWSENIDVSINSLYFIKPTSDGKMMAVRRDLANELDDWTYADAGASLYYWFFQYGVEKPIADRVIDSVYTGGVAQFEKDYTAQCDANGGCGD